MDFNILECKHFVAPSATSVVKRQVHNHELDYCIKGNRKVYINDKLNNISDGFITFQKPGDEIYSFGDYNCYILTVDFSKKTPNTNYRRNTSTMIEPICTNPLITSIPTSFLPFHSGELLRILSVLADQPDFESLAAHKLVEEAFYIINADLCRKSYEVNKPKIGVVDEVIQYINRHYCENLTLTDLANYSNLDKSYLCRIFKKRLGISPIEYIISQRLNHARTLIFNTDLSINEIASSSGYNNTSFFIMQYKKYYGLTPTQSRDIKF